MRTTVPPMVQFNHSAVTKYVEEKVYHLYVSNCYTNNQSIMWLYAGEIMDYTGAPENITIVWETDNCSYQRKSAEHFRDCQQLANLWLRIIVQIWGIAGHRKGEVDHVGDFAKVAARRTMQVTCGQFTFHFIVSFSSNHYCTNWTVVMTSFISYRLSSAHGFLPHDLIYHICFF